MSDIFLSYKSEDKAKAQIIAEALEKKGYSVWWDRVIPPGRRFGEVIEEELDDAKCVIVLWSSESVRSKWVETEASEGDSRKILVPVLIEDVKPPLAFRLIEAAKLMDWDGTLPNYEFDLLTKSVARILTTYRAPDKGIQESGVPKEEAERKKREEQEQLRKEETERKKREEQEQLRKEEAERKKREEEEQLRKEEAERKKREEEEQLRKEEVERKKREGKKKIEQTSLFKDEKQRKIIAVVIVLSMLLLGYWFATGEDNSKDEDTPTPTPPPTPTSSPTSTPAPTSTQVALSSFTNSIGMEFVLIQSGEFTLGSPSEETGRLNEVPLHNVKIGKPFYLGKYEVTQEQWREIMGTNPSSFEGDDLPVESVSWDDVQEFVRKLNQKEGIDKYRLPSEAEWEYAARAGTTTRYSFGDDESELEDYAWYYDNLGTHPVGQKKPNSWGLYDMHGNVWEWVQDEWHDSYEGAPTDGSAWEGGSGAIRVIRGGGWFDGAGDCRSAIRYGDDPGDRFNDLGFRLLREL